MQTTYIFRLVLIIQLLISLMSTITSNILFDTLPLVLQNYISQEQDFYFSGIFYLSFALLFFALIPICTIGLWHFKGWAKILFIFMLLITIPVELFSNVVIMDPWTGMLLSLNAMFLGMILVMLLMKPIKNKFTGQKTKNISFLVQVHTLPSDLQTVLNNPSSYLYDTAKIYSLLVNSPMLHKVWAIDTVDKDKLWIGINIMSDENIPSLHTVKLDEGTFEKIEDEQYEVEVFK
ncbi:hypothetical protein [Pseudoalteromonas denitrificans]|uniref:Uncharacterized protein n=1 Tax=Pseudoalteromonas denitrificans DSM 6059 TaxID=1123010 RepID=A0A1I1SWK3_9GAMM|nr:hypothetical protein [Pseudoalteromonas denitrificans]SFD49118.1 hypothetical protein SAMN02745724_04668 [Pseudoalteromonas denitrificans DSM 6059]